RNDIVLKLGATVSWIVDIDAALTEVSADLLSGRHGVNHGVGHCMAEAFIVQEEESSFVSKWAPQRCAKIVLHHVIVSHGFERCSIHSSVAQELVNRAVKFITSASGDDIDLPTASAAQLCRIAAGLDFELLHRIGRWAEILGIE